MSSTERPYLSIGEVLGLLLEEFPDVTISKIRFLESQGLIDPERTASGYRKFYDPDVDRLRVILREQRENFLPLRVIRDRLSTGTIDDYVTPPRGIRNVTVGATVAAASTPLRLSDISGTDLADLGTDTEADDHRGFATATDVDHDPDTDLDTDTDIDTDIDTDTDTEPDDSMPLPRPVGVEGQALSTRHPAAQSRPVFEVVRNEPPPIAVGELPIEQQAFSQLEVCSRAGISSQQLADLESFGLVVKRSSGAAYTAADVAVATACAGFLRRGVEARHLRAWKQAAEREASLVEQLVLPLLRQRNPTARQQAAVLADELGACGADLRAALLSGALRPLLHD